MDENQDTQAFPHPPEPSYQGSSPYVSNFGPAPQRMNTLAIVSLVLGISGFVTGLLTAIPAVVCGHISLNQIKETNEDGYSLAKAGLILGYIIIGLAVLAILAAIVLVVLVVAFGNVNIDIKDLSDGTIAMASMLF